MKTPRLIVTLLLVAFAFADVKANSQGTYSAKLISPRLGQVLYPGQQVSVAWDASLPKTHAGGCEMEIWLSLDGGRTFHTCITVVNILNTRYFDWTVPNTPTNAAVLDIRFGCEFYYPESYSPQAASTFVIAHSGESAPASH